MPVSLLPGNQASSALPMQWRSSSGELPPPPPPAPRKTREHVERAEPPPPPPPLPPVPQIDVEAIRREGYARGLQDGEQRAAEKASAHLQPVMEKLARTLATLVDQRARIRREAESELLELSIAIARRILNRELTLDPMSVQSLIKVALDKAQSSEISRIRVHPDQLAAVQTCVQRVRPSQASTIIADAGLDPWGVVFETSKGSVDASLEAQLGEISRGFADRLSAK